MQVITYKASGGFFGAPANGVELEERMKGTITAAALSCRVTPFFETQEEAEAAIAELPERLFSVFPRKRWTLVAEYMSNGQRTARWFKDNDTGTWYTAESWKRHNPHHPLNDEQQAYVEGAIGHLEGATA